MTPRPTYSWKTSQWRLAVGTLCAVVLALAPQARAQGKRAKDKESPPPDPMAEMEKLKADFEKKLADRDAESKEREAALKKEQEASLEQLRDESDKRLAAEREERQAEVLRLQKALEAASTREELREKQTPPRVSSAAAGLSLYGYLQADYQIRQSSDDQLSSDGQPLNQDRFLIRRARLGIAMDRGYGEGRIELDGNTVNGSAFRVLDAEASLKLPGATPDLPPLVMGTIGLFRIPFGREVTEDDRQRLFMERSTAAHALFPGEFDLGVRVMGGWQFVRYALAVQNGQPLDGTAFGGLDPNHQKDVVGRLGVEQAFGAANVVGGFSALRGTGFHKGAVATKPSLQWNDADESGTVSQGEISGSPGLAASPSSNFTRLAFGADLLLAYRWTQRLRTTVMAEFYFADDLDRAVLPADPKGVGRNYRELGYYAAVVQEIGRWRLGLRYDYYNPDQDANKNARGNPVPLDASFYTVAGVVACTASWGRLIVEYDHNRNHLGISATGMPTNLADDTFIVRGEVLF